MQLCAYAEDNIDIILNDANKLRLWEFRKS